ncbi:MAG: hypothetical protein COA57_07445 [Flavobacteriales bacterium]|nr:MAG: hypothetical protein COA57_07445 [Flavobacteriales bacterium]
MKKKLLICLVIIFAGFIVINTETVIPNGGGAPAGYTGSPSDGLSCGSGGCHGGGDIFKPGLITGDIPSSGYVPGDTFNISATVTQTATFKFGFQLSPQDASGNLQGELIATPNTQLVSNGKYITHIFSSTSGTLQKTWTFQWVAPAAGTGIVSFYAAFCAANNNNAVTGDLIHVSTLSVSEDVSTSIAESNNEVDLHVFPNPSNGVFELKMQNAKSRIDKMEIYNTLGKLVLKSEIPNLDSQIDISDQPKGIYFLLVSLDGEKRVERLIVK